MQNLRHRYIAHRVLAFRDISHTGDTRSTHLDALFEGKQTEDDSATAFVCENFACSAPVSGREAITELWARLESGESPVS